MIYIGLPQRPRLKWVRPGITSLEEYARYFSCVKGSITSYALPKADTVARWQAQIIDAFRFCSKFPAAISHQATLRNCDDLVQELFMRMSPPESHIGQYWLQLLVTFNPRDLPALWQFLDTLPKPLTHGVEVHHPDLFAEGETEQLFNRGSHKRGVNRVILDSRPVHVAILYTEAIHDAQRKKPKVLVYAVVTANHPMIRFIGSDDMAQNGALPAVRLTKLSLWQRTTAPYLFLHTPGIAQAPESADMLWADLHSTLLEIRPAPPIPQQSSLF